MPRGRRNPEGIPSIRGSEPVAVTGCGSIPRPAGVREVTPLCESKIMAKSGNVAKTPYAKRPEGTLRNAPYSRYRRYRDEASKASEHDIAPTDVEASKASEDDIAPADVEASKASEERLAAQRPRAPYRYLELIVSKKSRALTIAIRR